MSIFVTGLLVVPWLLIVKAEWVRLPALAYARALLQTCDVLAAERGAAGSPDAAVAQAATS